MSKEATLKHSIFGCKRQASLWSGLQFRMTLSYALTTVAAMLLLEVLAGLSVAFLLTYSTAIDGIFVAGAQRTAKLYALAAAAQAQGGTLDPNTTFEPNRPSSIALPKDYFSDQGYIQYSDLRSSATQSRSFVLLVASDSHVVASTYPAGFARRAPVSHLLPGGVGYIRDALAGRSGAIIAQTSQGRIIIGAEPVWSRGKAIGAIYVQLSVLSSWTLLKSVSQIWLGSGIFLLVLTLLVGGLFGLVTTRGLVQRLRSLAAATTRFADGDYTQRVRVSRSDEVGQLEGQFNRMAEQLVESINQRQALAGQNARMAERDRLARDLHDSVKQQVFAASMQLGAALSLLDVKKETARHHLMEAENLANQVQQELATLIQELRPLALQDKGLVAALREYVTTWSRQQGVTVDGHIADTCIIPLEVEEALWRVAQEALSNIARHSHASEVQVALTCEQDKVLLAIEDNGKGFDSSIKASGVGLHSMQERMQALGGMITIQSEIGEGTRIHVQYTGTQVKSDALAERSTKTFQQ